MPRTHAALPRLFVDHPLEKGQVVALDKDQSLYLATVLRKQLGDEVVLFNGQDGAWLGRINSTGKKSVVLELIEQIAPQPTPADLWYGFAPLKSVRLDYVIQKSTEMGASIIQPVVTRFTQVSRIKLDRMRANAIEAAEQCEVLNIPRVEVEVSLEKLVASWPAVHGVSCAPTPPLSPRSLSFRQSSAIGDKRIAFGFAGDIVRPPRRQKRFMTGSRETAWPATTTILR
jgi:16S rRNA (uracil1498-N3)-methyltransferase